MPGDEAGAGEMGLTNVILMLPFVRRVAEAEHVLAAMAELGLRRGENGLKVYAMCEIPNNVILIDRFAKLFDGFSIGSNDLTQLTLGVDRDSDIVAFDYDERDEGVKEMIRLAVEGCRRNGIHSGLCGQAPSDYPDMAEYLVEIGIDSMSLNPDTVIKTTQPVLEVEKQPAGSMSSDAFDRPAAGPSNDLTPLPDLLHGQARAGPVRERRPVYVDLLPPCNAGCPAGENIQAWLAHAKAGRHEHAWRQLVADNPFAAIHGRVCYHPCETVCNRAHLDSSVSIHSVERFLGDLACERGWSFERPSTRTGKRVLVIGAGPERIVRRLPFGPPWPRGRDT